MSRNRQSIHPRVVKGRTKHKKVSTARGPDPNVTARKIKAVEGHLERHPYSKPAAAHLHKLINR